MPEQLPLFADDGLEVAEHGKGKRAWARISCRECKTVLVVTEGAVDTAKQLALTNVGRNPCCDRWRHG